MKNIAVCIFAPAKLDKSAQGLVGAGYRLARECDGHLRVIVLGSGAEQIANEVARVAETVIIADQKELSEYHPESSLNALTTLCKEMQPLAVLLSSEMHNQEIAPRLAYRLSGSSVGDGIQVSKAGPRLRVTRAVYGGRAHAVIEMKRYPAVIWLRSRGLDPPEADNSLGEIKRVTLDIPANHICIVERKYETTTELRLEDAHVIIAGGRGIGGPEPFVTELRPLAEMLGAQLAASRAACDAGWVPSTMQVGQTGKRVAPDLYLAVGISGASQHLMGISDAKNIAAINIDADAPIFKHSRIGIVADYRIVLPLLRKQLMTLCK